MWDKNKVIGTKQMISLDSASVTQVSLNPFDATLSLVLGQKTLKTVRYMEGELVETILPGAADHV
jgi:hypothetical protein